MTDQAGFKVYADRQEVLVKKHGGRLIVRGGSVIAVEGTAPKRMTEYVFEDTEQFKAWLKRTGAEGAFIHSGQSLQVQLLRG